MDRDPLVRLLLAGILVALVALWMQASDGSGGGLSPVGSHYVLESLRAGSPILFRTDTRNGETWKLELRGGNDQWKRIREPGEEDVIDTSGTPGPADATPRIPPPAASAVPEARPDPVVELAKAAPSRDPLPGREGPEWDLDALTRALVQPDLDVDLRLWSAQRLALQDVPQSTDALLAAQDDPNPSVVAAALTALAGRYDPRIAEAVAAARAHPDPAVQAAAAAFGQN